MVINNVQVLSCLFLFLYTGSELAIWSTTEIPCRQAEEAGSSILTTTEKQHLESSLDESMALNV